MTLTMCGILCFNSFRHSISVLFYQHGIVRDCLFLNCKLNRASHLYVTNAALCRAHWQNAQYFQIVSIELLQGGFKAVVATDTFQGVIMLVGSLVVLILVKYLSAHSLIYTCIVTVLALSDWTSAGGSCYIYMYMYLRLRSASGPGYGFNQLGLKYPIGLRQQHTS